MDAEMSNGFNIAGNSVNAYILYCKDLKNYWRYMTNSEKLI